MRVIEHNRQRRKRSFDTRTTGSLDTCCTMHTSSDSNIRATDPPPHILHYAHILQLKHESDRSSSLLHTCCTTHTSSNFHIRAKDPPAHVLQSYAIHTFSPRALAWARLPVLSCPSVPRACACRSWPETRPRGPQTLPRSPRPQDDSHRGLRPRLNRRIPDAVRAVAVVEVLVVVGAGDTRAAAPRTPWSW